MVVVTAVLVLAEVLVVVVAVLTPVLLVVVRLHLDKVMLVEQARVVVWREAAAVLARLVSKVVNLVIPLLVQVV